MQHIIKDQQVVADNWQVFDVEAESGIPANGDYLVPYRFWMDNHAELKSRDGNVAPILDGELDFTAVMAEAGDTLLASDMIALLFPAFKDGRCYSFARLLRERHGYLGELRAIGDILHDQLYPMARCGINAFAVREDRDPEAALAAFSEFTVTYQPAADESLPLFRRVA